MAFVVEDGTGIEDANSYVDIVFADSYFADRSNTKWAGTNAQKQSWLIAATDYAEQVFGAKWIGDARLVEAQGLSWPRTFEGVSYELPDFRAGVPLLLRKAICEYAVRAIDGPLLPDPVFDATGFSVVTTKKKVGPIEKEFQARGTSSQPKLVRPYPAADTLLTSLLRPGTGGGRVAR